MSTRGVNNSTGEMLKTALDVNYSTGGMMDTTQDANYSTGGMMDTTQDANYSNGGMMDTTQDANYSTGGNLKCYYELLGLGYPTKKIKCKWKSGNVCCVQCTYIPKPIKNQNSLIRLIINLCLFKTVKITRILFCVCCTTS